MKFYSLIVIKIIFTLFFVTLSLSNKKFKKTALKNKVLKNKSHKNINYNEPLNKYHNTSLDIKPDSQTKHVQDIFNNNISEVSNHLNPLWNNYAYSHKGTTPKWNGNSKYNYQIPYVDNSLIKKHISSPVVNKHHKDRIIPNELPTTTYSKSYFDYPLRHRVEGANIPQSTTRISEYHINPWSSKKVPILTTKGTMYHNTGSSISDYNHAYNNKNIADDLIENNNYINFIQNKEKNSNAKAKRLKSKFSKNNKKSNSGLKKNKDIILAAKIEKIPLEASDDELLNNNKANIKENSDNNTINRYHTKDKNITEHTDIDLTSRNNIDNKKNIKNNLDTTKKEIELIRSDAVKNLQNAETKLRKIQSLSNVNNANGKIKTPIKTTNLKDNNI